MEKVRTQHKRERCLPPIEVSRLFVSFRIRSDLEIILDFDVRSLLGQSNRVLTSLTVVS